MLDVERRGAGQPFAVEVDVEIEREVFDDGLIRPRKGMDVLLWHGPRSIWDVIPSVVEGSGWMAVRSCDHPPGSLDFARDDNRAMPCDHVGGPELIEMAETFLREAGTPPSEWSGRRFRWSENPEDGMWASIVIEVERRGEN